MPRDREKYNAYMRKYMNARYHRRMTAARKKLGVKCVICGSRDGLQFDHVDPATKNFEIGTQGSSVSEADFQAELTLCQLLCTSCHTKKTLREKGQVLAQGTHGTLAAYRYCGPLKCELCRKAKREWMRVYRDRRQAVKPPSF